MTQTMSDAQKLISKGLQRERSKKGYSLSELSKIAGVAKSTLSQIEAGNGNPSIETVWALATALDVPFSALMAPEEPLVQVIRKGEGTAVQSEQADYQAVLLSTCPPSTRRDLYLATVQPGSPRLSDPHAKGVREHVILVQGKALVGLEAEPYELSVGDYICYPGDQVHIFQALENDTVAVFVTEH